MTDAAGRPTEAAPAPRAPAPLDLLAGPVQHLHRRRHDPQRPDPVRRTRRRGIGRTDAPDPDRLGDDHRGPRPADGRVHLRLHDLALGPTQAVHLHRLDPRLVFLAGHRVQPGAGRDRRVRGPAPVQRQLRPGPVPGVRPGPRPGAAGRDGQRAGRPVADPRQRVRVHHRVGSPSRSNQFALGSHRPRRARGRDDARRRLPGPRGSHAQGPRGPIVVVDRPRGVGHRHPARAQLPVPRRCRAWPSSWPATC